jgi:hypothetical protein
LHYINAVVQFVGPIEDLVTAFKTNKFTFSLVICIWKSALLIGEGCTDRLIHTALRTNELAGNPIDPIQLEAAVYMHDVGMAFLAELIWTKYGKLTDQELAVLREHPALSSAILKRMSGWNEATKM